MLKKISIDKLVPDMFVAELIASEDSKLPKKKAGMVRDPRIIKKFEEVGIIAVVIDTDKGRDVVQVMEVDKSAVEQESREIEDTGKLIPENVEIPVNEALAKMLGDLIDDTNAEQEYHSLELEWRTATEIFTTSSAVINSSLKRIKNKAPFNAQYFSQAACAISQSLMRNPDALTWLGKIRTEKQYIYEHAVNSAVLMGIFAQAAKLKPADVEACVAGALLHDMGEALIDEAVYYKNGPLTDDEYSQMKEHVMHSKTVIEGFDKLPQITKDIILQHHERCDGSGYPEGLKKDEISVYARMFAIVDTFDAMTTNKTYKKAQPSSICMKELLTLNKSEYDEQLLHIFIKSMGIYPTSSLVKLNTHTLAVVIAQNPQAPLKPLVKVIYNSKTNQYLSPYVVDLVNPRMGEKILKYEDPRDYNIDVIEFMPEEMQWA